MEEKRGGGHRRPHDPRLRGPGEGQPLRRHVDPAAAEPRRHGYCAISHVIVTLAVTPTSPPSTGTGAASAAASIRYIGMGGA